MAGEVQFASVRHLLLHFDLDTKSGDRDATYAAIEGIQEPFVPRRLTGSVFLVPIGEGISPLTAAFRFWEALAAATKGALKDGDTFYVHVVGGQPGYMDVLYQRVDATKKLDDKPETTVLELMFLSSR